MHSLLGLQQIRERRGEQKLVCSKNKVILFSQPQERGHISEDIKPLLYIWAVGGGEKKNRASLLQWSDYFRPPRNVCGGEEKRSKAFFSLAEDLTMAGANFLNEARVFWHEFWPSADTKQVAWKLKSPNWAHSSGSSFQTSEVRCLLTCEDYTPALEATHSCPI